MIYLIQHFEADFLWKDSLKILNSGFILKTFTHVIMNIEGANFNTDSIVSLKSLVKTVILLALSL